MKPNPRLTPQLRHFVELVLSGKTKTEAYATAYRKEPNTDATRNAASRTWKCKTAGEYRRELADRAKINGNGMGGEAALAKLDERKRLQEAADLSREELLAFAGQALVFGATDLIELDSNSPNFGRPRPDRAHLIQSFKVATDGSITLAMVPKVPMWEAYVKLRGIEPEKEAKKWTPAGTVEALAAQLAENPDAMDAIEDAVQFTQRALEMAHALTGAGSGLAS